MDELKTRTTYFNLLKRQLTLVNQLRESDVTIGEVNAHILQAEKYITTIEHAHVVLLSTAADGEAEQVQSNIYDSIFDTVMQIRVKLQNLKSAVEPRSSVFSASSSSQSSSHHHHHIKLPDLHIPHFDGRYEEWQSFFDTFSATIDKHDKLAPSQKLQYLRTYLKGDAAALIKSFTITDANYQEALCTLKDRYDNPREIIHSLIKKLLFQPSLKVESLASLQTMLNTTNENLRSLKVMGRPTEHWDDLITVLLIEKLDPATKAEWAKGLTDTKPPTLKEVTTFLEQQIRTLHARGNHSTIKSQPQRTQLSSHHVAVAQTQCKVCSGNHQVYQCTTFKEMTPERRYSTAKSVSLCLNCLGNTHVTSRCMSKSSCHKCNQRHHTSIHLDTKSHNSNNNNNRRAAAPAGPVTSHSPAATTATSSHHNQFPQQNQPVVFRSNSCFSSHSRKTLLKTALIDVCDKNNHRQQCRLLLDDGSEASFISESVASRLGLHRERADVIITGISAEHTYHSQWKSYVRLLSQNNELYFDVELYHLPKVTETLPRIQGELSKWKHINGLNLADPAFCQGGDIDILVGAEVVPYIMHQDIRKSDVQSPVAQNSIFGWILSGKINQSQPITFRSFTTACTITDQLRKFWEIEQIAPNKIPLTQEEQQCEDHFISTHERQQNGRFIVRLPFKEETKVKLGSTREQAVHRLYSLEKRFRKYPKQKLEYIKFMDEYESLGHMEKSQSPSPSTSTFYLPHHFVIKDDSTTTKLRVVFDGSAKSSTGVSLNQALLVGPTVQSDLYTILLRFRYNAIAIKADIAKMYRQFNVHSSDTTFQRILWRKDESHPIQEYKLTTVTYGTASAPYLATRCLLKLAEENQSMYPEEATVLQRDSYVDDIMSGGTTPSNVITLVQNLNKIVSSGGMELRKWCSNNQEVMAQIPEALRESNELLSFDDDSTSVKALGIQWNPMTDSFLFSVKATPHQVITKRYLLSEISKTFDPVGWLAPLTITAKLLLQQLWLHGYDWDKAVSSELVQTWEQYQSDLNTIQQLRIPRCVITSKPISIQLHGFCDASERAYASAVYIRVEYAGGNISVNLLTSKTRVAPVQQISLPKLELCGCKLLTDTITAVLKSVSFEHTLYCWSDSTIALRWISSHSRKWKTFIANRVSEIQSTIAPEHWHHVRSADNPADLPSRGMSAEELIKSKLWWHGPNWLQSSHYPISAEPCDEDEVKKEERKQTITCLHLITSSAINKLFSEFSSLRKLCRATAYYIRFISFLKDKKNTPLGQLTASELNAALNKLIQCCQKLSFPSEIIELQQGRHIKTSSKLNQLNPFVDFSNVLRVGGRLHKSDIPEDTKHPIILPTHHPLTTLIIEQTHNDCLHSGFTLTHAVLRRKYWILRGRDQIRFTLRRCVTCKKIKAQTSEQLMGSLPIERVTPNKPFHISGVDFAGPFGIRMKKGRNAITEKCYFSIFICFSTKAIHLEAVTNLTSDAFIACYERFISRRGVPMEIHSDCGTNFVGADRAMKKMLQQANKGIHQSLANRGTSWIFNPPSSPHQGGLWEAGVKSVKYHFKRVVGGATLTFEQFTTLLCKIEACLNSRPICALSSDPTDLEALTPGHFLVGGPLTHIPEPDMKQVKQNQLGYWEQTRQMSQHFWTRWSAEYLSNLQQRFKWKNQRANLQVGDLVVVKDEQLPLTKWKLGRIEKTFPGHDGLVRVVSLKTGSGSFTRPIQKLIPLITNDE